VTSRCFIREIQSRHCSGSPYISDLLNAVLDGNVFKESIASADKQRICDSIDSESVYDRHNKSGRWSEVRHGDFDQAAFE
jgi:hypothetical protein